MDIVKVKWVFDPWTGKRIPAFVKRTDPWIFDPWTGTPLPAKKKKVPRTPVMKTGG